jgi:transposase-like protein
MPTPARLPLDRPRWTEEDARAVLAALERSGKPLSVFAEEHGLDPQRLYAWRRRVAGGDGTTFRELIVRRSTGPAATVARDSFEVLLPSGVSVRVPPSFDAAALERLLVVLQAPGC